MTMQSVFSGIHSAAIRYRRYTVVPLLVLSVLLYGNLANVIASQTVTATPLQFFQPAAHSSTTLPAAATATASTTHSQPAAVASTAHCTPSSYTFPGQIELESQPNGLSEVTDAASQYRIYGFSAAQLRSQIQQCAPRPSGASSAEFTSETGYQLNWSYNYTQLPSGLCQVTDAKIGLHIAMVLPLWQPTANTPAALSSQWQTFMDSLTTHENGHVALDRQYAAQMLTDLQSYPSTDCGVLTQSVSNALNNDVIQLNVANDRYDTATDHGATQGAVLPQ